MKFAILASIAIAIIPITAAQSQSLPGVEDKETSIPGGGIQEYHRGHGDVVFMRDRNNRWYRVQTNKGCFNDLGSSAQLAVRSDDIGGKIDRMSSIIVDDGVPRTCRVDSIRRSEAPPQVDSNSKVTLD